MGINLADIKDLADLLAANVRLKLDYKLYINKTRKLLIVEGKTDDVFIKHLKDESVDCIIAASVFSSNNQFHTNPAKQFNSKNAIVTLITGISHYPSPFVRYPEDIDKWDLYGLVDADCEEITTSRPTPRLFITDTHDLETLLLWTDEELLSNLKECEISQEDVIRAYFLAYQLALILDELYDYRGDIGRIHWGAEPVEFSSFIESEKVNVPHLISYMNDQSENSVSAAKVKTITQNVCKSKGLKKKLDANGIWKQSVQDFQTAFPSDFWDLVNGHSILQLIRFLSEDAAHAFDDPNGFSLNRSFEMSLIAAYDYSQFAKTEIDGKMKKEGII